MKIGIYGGTFNPIHMGHLGLAKNCADSIGLDKVIFIPTFSPPHKSSDGVADPLHRLNMCKMAVAYDPRFEVSDIEIRRGGVSYTVDTLWELQEQQKDAELYLIVGSDMYLNITSWRLYQEIFRLAVVVAAPRESDINDLLSEQKQKLDAACLKSMVLEVKAVEVSSTEIRNGEKLHLLPQEVLDYITQNSLYFSSEAMVKYDIQSIWQKLSTMLDKKRFSHSMAVAEQALILAQKNGVDEHLAYVAGMVHDICKGMDKQQLLEVLKNDELLKDEVFLSQPQIWHGFAGAIFIDNELKIHNSQIIGAIRCHTTGKADMSVFEKIIFLADLISSDRDYSDVERVRKICYNNLDEGMAFVLKFTLSQLVEQARPLFDDTLKAYNFYIHHYKG